jgi:hypothetical protein
MRGDFLSTKCYFIEKNKTPGANIIGRIKRPRSFLKIGRLSDALTPELRGHLAASAGGYSCRRICFKGVWGDGISGPDDNFCENADKYRGIFAFFSSLKLIPHVSVDGAYAGTTAPRIREFLDMASDGMAPYWRHSSFELVRPREVYEPLFMETYAASYEELRAFSKDIKIGFRIGAANTLHALDLFEEGLILCKNNSCVPDFVTLDIKPAEDDAGTLCGTQAQYAMYIINDIGTDVKTLYVAEHDSYCVPGGTCATFDVSACA